MRLVLILGTASFRESIVANDPRVGVGMDEDHTIATGQLPAVAGVKSRAQFAAVGFSEAAIAKDSRNFQIGRQLAGAGNKDGFSGGYAGQMLVIVVEGGGIKGQARTDLQSLARFVGEHGFRSEVRIARQV